MSTPILPSSQLDAKEEEARISMLLDIQDAVRSKFPNASISQFGSHPVGLSIFLSDVDISVDNATSAAPAPVPALTAGTPSATPTITPKRLSNTAHVASIVRRDSFGSNMSDGTIKRSSSLVDNPINKRIKFNEDTTAKAVTATSEEVEEDIEVTWSIDNNAGETSAPATSVTTSATTLSGLHWEDRLRHTAPSVPQRSTILAVRRAVLGICDQQASVAENWLSLSTAMRQLGELCRWCRICVLLAIHSLPACTMRLLVKTPR